MKSAAGHKSQVTLALKATEGAMGMFESLKSSVEANKMDDHMDKAHHQLEKTHEIIVECMELLPAQRDKIYKEYEAYEKKVMDMQDRVTAVKLKVGKGNSDSRTPTELSASGRGKCKPNTALKPENLELQDTPAKLRVWKDDYKDYFNIIIWRHE